MATSKHRRKGKIRARKRTVVAEEIPPFPRFPDALHRTLLDRGWVMLYDSGPSTSAMYDFPPSFPDPTGVVAQPGDDQDLFDHFPTGVYVEADEHEWGTVTATSFHVAFAYCGFHSFDGIVKVYSLDDLMAALPGIEAYRFGDGRTGPQP